MSTLDFLSPGRARRDGGFEPLYRSPLERPLRDAPSHVRDVSLVGKLEVRGDLSAGDAGDVMRITPTRGLVVCDYEETAAMHERLRARFAHVVDLTAAFAGIELTGVQLMRRLTDLDLDALPAAGAVARVPAIVVRDGDGFRIFFPQEYGDHVARVVLDAAAGLA